MSNILMKLILSGTIQSIENLKGLYHKIIMKTHPDAVGSNLHLEKYLELHGQYEEALAYLVKSNQTQSISDKIDYKNHRLSFFQHLNLIESMEMPYAFHPEENIDQLFSSKNTAKVELSKWRIELLKLYINADKEYVKIKTEKPMGPYLKHALALNVRPLVHNIIGYHITGRKLYAKQAKQNQSAIMHQLTENGCLSLRDFLSILIEDMNNGAAVLE
jgi:hypothetical protein